jgi:phage baseplate assembly protein W
LPGLSRHIGQRLGDRDHLRQSIEDILTTPIGSRVMRRDYGSRLYELIDKPMTSALKVDIFAAAIEALRKWEPRFIVERVFVVAAAAGEMVLGIVGRDTLGNGIELEEVIL